jgi:hypothetical protein
MAVQGLGLHKGLAVVAAHKAAASVLAVAVVGGAGATAATGSVNPVVWGQQVRAIVTQCKTERSPGERGIGHCVSGFNEQRDDQRRGPTPRP